MLVTQDYFQWYDIYSKYIISIGYKFVGIKKFKRLSKSIELLLSIVFAYISASLEKKENCDLPSITVFKIMFLIFVH